MTGEPIDLERYAEQAQLPIELLRKLGLKDGRRHRVPAVRVPYGDGVPDVWCTGDPDQAASWDRPRTSLYGLQWLDAGAERVVVVEGELAVQTLRRHGIAAVGVPPGAPWRPEWTAALADAGFVCVALPESAGVAEWIGELPIRDRVSVLAMPDGLTVNALHQLAGDRFSASWGKLLEGARSWPEIDAAHRDAARDRAREKCKDLLAEPRILEAFARDLRAHGFAGDTRVSQLLFLVIKSRVLLRPVSFALKGSSAVGKSYLVKLVLDFSVPEAYYEVTAMSDKALIYSHEPLGHRVLVLYEADGMSEVANLTVRSLLSEGRIVYDTVIDMQPVRIEREGPTGLVTTTTRVALHPENETRMLSETLEVDPERITEILIATADQRHLPDEVLRRWRELDEYIALGPTEVMIPYARTLAAAIPPVSVRLQRDFAHLLSLIRVHALLHEQRERDRDGQVIATLDDYEVVRDLLNTTVSEAADQKVPKEVRDTVEVLTSCGPHAYPHGEGVTTQTMTYKLGLDRSTVSRRMRRAAALGFVAELTGTTSGKAKRWVIGDRLLDHAGGRDVFPPVEQLRELWTAASTTQEDDAHHAG